MPASTRVFGDVELVHKSTHLLVLCKPAGLSTTRTDDGDCLARRAASLDPDAPALHALSRLDTMVTGLVAFARTRELNRRVLEARRQGRFGRSYVALSTGVPDSAAGDWRWPIARHLSDPRLRRALDPGQQGPEARDACTQYVVAARTAGLSALRLWPHSGRTHQLRVHAARAGCPLLGDRAYGGDRRLMLADGGVLASRRVQLHCGYIHLPDPSAAGGWLELRAPPQPDMAALWQAAGGEASALSAGPE